MSSETSIKITGDGKQFTLELGRMTGAMENFSKAVDKAAEGSEKSGKTISEIWRDVSTSLNQTIEVAQKAGAAMKSVWDFAKEGAELGKAREAFSRFAGSLGQSSDIILASLRKASGGTITDLKLIEKASMAMSLGVTKDADTMANLLEIARNKGALMGRSVEEAFDDIVIGLGRMSPKILDNLGIRIPESFNKTTEGMSETKKMAELVRLTLEAGNTELEAMGGTVETAADKFVALETAFTNLKASGGELISIAISPLVVELANVVEQANAAIKAIMDIQHLAKVQLARQDPEARAAAEILERAETLKTQRESLRDLLAEMDSAKDNDLLTTIGFRERAMAQGVQGVEGEWSRAAMRDMILDARKAYTEEEKVLRYQRELTLKSKVIKEDVAAIGQGYMDLVSSVIPSFSGETTKATGATKKTVDELGKAFQQITDQLIKGFGADGKQAIGDAENALFAATKAAGGLALALKNGVTETGRLAAEADKLTEKFSSAMRSGFGKIYTPEQQTEMAVEGMTDLLGVGWILRGEGKKPSQGGIEARAKETLEQPLSRVFNNAFVEALEGGDFFDALGKGLRRTMTEAFANSLTEALFSQSGSVMATSGGGSGGGGVPGLLMKPWTHSKAAGGGINWGNAGTNVAIALAADRLFGEGGLFGSTVVHGGEVLDQYSAMSQQVVAANEARRAWGSTAGISDQTRSDLGVTLWTPGYRSNPSGNGITSKKTLTYELDAADFSRSMEAFNKAVVRATEEMNKRAYEIEITSIDDPIKAIKMRLDDLAQVLYDGQGNLRQFMEGYTPANWYDMLLEESRLKKQMESSRAGWMDEGRRGFNDWFTQYGTAAMQTPGLGFPTTQPPFEYLHPEKGATIWSLMGDDPRESLWGTKWTVEAAKQQALMSQQFAEQWSKASRSGDTATLIDLLSNKKKGYADTQSILQVSLDSDQAVFTSANSTEQEKIDAGKRIVGIIEQISQLSLAMLDTEEQILDIREREKQEEQQARDQRTNDILGTFLTRVGEVSTNKAGQQVIVLSPGQPDGRALAREIIEAIGGEKPELATALNQFLNQTAKPYF